MAVPSLRPGTVCWVDLGTPDVPRAAGFYQALFGWDIADPDENGYRLCSIQGRLAGALGPAEDPGPPYWTTNIGVTDIAAATADFTAAGATVRVPPTRAGDAGVFAVFTDPAGTPVSLWQPGTHAGMHTVAEHGTFSTVELLTHAPRAAARFYTRALGWTFTDDGTVRLAGDPIASWTPTPPHPPTAPTHAPDADPIPATSRWLVGFAVDDVDAAARRAVRLGAARAESRSDMTVLTDPTGAVFGLRPATI